MPKLTSCNSNSALKHTSRLLGSSERTQGARVGKRTGRWKGNIYEGVDSREEALGVLNVTAQVEYLDETYDFQPYKEKETTEQGWLVLARLEPKTDSLPKFSLRWDDKEGHLNVDIHGVGDAERYWFKNGENGYSGHLAQQASDKGRAFDSEITLPGMRVFKGRFTFNLRWGMEARVRIAMKVAVDDSLSR
jgi:hypothetical protein